MTGYPQGSEAETRSGIFVPYETPKKKLLPPTALPIRLWSCLLLAPGPANIYAATPWKTAGLCP